jgi:serine/threonine protein kinase
MSRLIVGEKLRPYEIAAQIGAGGMGEVYRARDPRLNRDVAIKIAGERSEPLRFANSNLLTFRTRDIARDSLASGCVPARQEDRHAR